jgi:hypothetical protein
MPAPRIRDDSRNGSGKVGRKMPLGKAADPGGKKKKEEKTGDIYDK